MIQIHFGVEALCMVLPKDRADVLAGWEMEPEEWQGVGVGSYL